MLPTKYITQDWVANATAQEIYNYITKHLLSQNRKSELYGSCAYFGDTDDNGVEWVEPGLYCAAGCLLKDTKEIREFVNDECENQIWATLIENGYAPTNQATIINGLQLIHDSCCPKDWYANLKYFALENGLEPC